MASLDVDADSSNADDFSSPRISLLFASFSSRSSLIGAVLSTRLRPMSNTNPHAPEKKQCGCRGPSQHTLSQEISAAWKSVKGVVCYIKDIESAIPICSIYVRVEVVRQKDYRCKLKEDAEGDESNASRERRDAPFGRNVAAFPRCVSDLVEVSWTIGNRGIVYHSFL